jgi:hypothetical protein
LHIWFFISPPFIHHFLFTHFLQHVYLFHHCMWQNLKFSKRNKKNFRKRWKEFALLLMLLVSGLNIKGSRCGGWWKVGESGGQSLAGYRKWVAGRPSPLSFSLFSSTTLSFTSTTTTLGSNGGALATWAGRPAISLGWPATPWLPYKRVAKGSLLLHPISSQATSNFLNPSPSSKFA